MTSVAFAIGGKKTTWVDIFEDLILEGDYDRQWAYCWKNAINHSPDKSEQLSQAIERIGLGFEVACIIDFLASQQLEEDEKRDMPNGFFETKGHNRFVDILRKTNNQSGNELLREWRNALRYHYGERLTFILQAIEVIDSPLIVAQTVLFLVAHWLES